MKRFVVRRRAPVVGLALLCLVSAPRSAAAQPPRELTLHGAAKVRFATLDESRTLLSEADRFVKAMSVFDRQCRLQSAEAVDELQLLRFVAAQARDWDQADIERLTPLVASVRRRLMEFHLPLPPTVLLIKTSGLEESGAAYCRGNAIVLPDGILSARDDGQLERLLIHELFHVLSRHAPDTRRALYEIVGFQTCDPIPFPAALAARKITNPDAPLLDCVIALKQADGATQYATPILIADEAYQPDRSKSLFQYLQFRLLVVEHDGDVWRAREPDGQPQLLDPRGTPSFTEQIGRNTGYIIHPDEILADNFAHLMLGTRELPSPQIVEQMRAVLR
jgi:hypothetical protein